MEFSRLAPHASSNSEPAETHSHSVPSLYCFADAKSLAEMLIRWVSHRCFLSPPISLPSPRVQASKTPLSCKTSPPTLCGCLVTHLQPFSPQQEQPKLWHPREGATPGPTATHWHPQGPAAHRRQGGHQAAGWVTGATGSLSCWGGFPTPHPMKGNHQSSDSARGSRSSPINNSTTPELTAASLQDWVSSVNGETWPDLSWVQCQIKTKRNLGSKAGPLRQGLLLIVLLPLGDDKATIPVTDAEFSQAVNPQSFCTGVSLHHPALIQSSGPLIDMSDIRPGTSKHHPLGDSPPPRWGFLGTA